MTGQQIRQLRADRPQSVFGQAVREEIASLLNITLSFVPSVGAAQVSRWERDGLEPGRKLTTLVYWRALESMRSPE